MFHTMLETLAVALTETVPSAADAVIGPKVTSVGWSTHIHTGRPTKPARLAPDSGTLPLSLGSRFIAATARWARPTGSLPTSPVPVHLSSTSHPRPRNNTT